MAVWPVVGGEKAEKQAGKSKLHCTTNTFGDFPPTWILCEKDKYLVYSTHMSSKALQIKRRVRSTSSII
jgi:hypothetical protein